MIKRVVKFFHVNDYFYHVVYSDGRVRMYHMDKTPEDVERFVAGADWSMEYDNVYHRFESVYTAT